MRCCIYIIMFVIRRAHAERFLPYFVLLVLISDLVLGKYSLLLFHREIPYRYLRNYIFVGIPYFSIGTLIYNKRRITLQRGEYAVLDNRNCFCMYNDCGKISVNSFGRQCSKRSLYRHNVFGICVIYDRSFFF